MAMSKLEQKVLAELKQAKTYQEVDAKLKRLKTLSPKALRELILADLERREEERQQQMQDSK